MKDNILVLEAKESNYEDYERYSLLFVEILFIG